MCIYVYKNNKNVQKYLQICHWVLVMFCILFHWPIRGSELYKYVSLLTINHLSYYTLFRYPSWSHFHNPPRHRSINLFLNGYQNFWIETEEYSFEEKLVQDLAVSTDIIGHIYQCPLQCVFYVSIINYI